MSTKSSSDNSNKSPEGLQELPAGFVPGDHDVVIGKGKKFYFHTGNQWLRTLVSSMLDEYAKAQTKSDKSNIISDVVEYVRQHGRFVRRELKTGKWVYAEPLLCREKCSQTFRDNLAETYRSSNVSKRNKRRAEQQEKKRMPEAKRMRTNAPALAMAPAASAASNVLQQGQAQSQPIPSNLFDLEMPLWSPKQRSASLLSTGLDFSALTRGSITGTAGPDNSNHLNLNAPTNTNTPVFQLSGLSSVNLMQSLPDILSNLSQLNNSCSNIFNNTNNTVAHPGHGSTQDFEPSPLAAALPPLTGSIDTMPPLDSSLTNLFEPTPMAEKRLSLALISEFDWFKAAATATTATVNNDQQDQQAQRPDFDPKISAAFAA